MIEVRVRDEDAHAAQSELFERAIDTLRLVAGVDNEGVSGTGTTHDVAVGPEGAERECCDVQGDSGTPQEVRSRSAAGEPRGGKY
jgi:hypothetical protein